MKRKKGKGAERNTFLIIITPESQLRAINTQDGKLQNTSIKSEVVLIL